MAPWSVLPPELAATAAALVAGLLVLAFWFRSSRSAPAPPKPPTPTPMVQVHPPPVKVDADDGRKRVTIFYGTHTGTAESFAKTIAGEAKARYEKPVFQVVDLEDYAADDQEYEHKFNKETLVIFFLATHGDGEPPANAAGFYKWLTERKEKEVWLKDLKYAVFGLGNREYEHFNKVGTEVDGLLLQHGGKRLVPCGLGDDGQCIQDDFTAWKELLWLELDQLLLGESI